ncbi:MAG: DUF4143 domain-containing protein [Puniceicoccaceae bacterium]
MEAGEFYPSYWETYVERDVRGLRNIGNLSLFRKFLLLCAGRSGQLLNLTALGNEVGVDHKTIQSWISVLEAGFLVYRLPPCHRSWNKRVVKQAKLIFLDTGVLCALLGIRGENDLRTHPLRGAIFESWVVSEALKHQMNRGLRAWKPLHGPSSIHARRRRSRGDLPVAALKALQSAPGLE